MSIPDKDTIKRHFSIIVRYNLFACNKAELGDMIDFPSIRTNSIQKMPIDKMTMAYTVFHNEVFNLYYEKAELSFVMDEFTDAVEFYKNNELKRMTAFSAENRYESCMALAEYAFGDHTEPSNHKLAKLAFQVYDLKRRVCNINVAFLILLILGIIDECGDIKDRLDDDFQKMKDFTEAFFAKYMNSADFPFINIKSQDFKLPEHHHRFFLLAAFDIAMLSISSMLDEEYDFYQDQKSNRRYFDIEDSIWKDNFDNNLYYLFEYSTDVTYNLSVFSYHKGQTEIKYTKYLFFFFYDDKNILSVFVLHPRGSYYVATGEGAVSNNERAWYDCQVNDRIKPTIIEFTPKYAKPNFEFHADRLTRLDDSESEYIISALKDERTVLINRYSQYEASYLDGTMVYAITQENIFFKDIVSGEGYFCVPKRLDERLESLHIDDNAGLAMIGDTPYIRFEMFNLNYNISDSGQLQKSGISKVENIF